MHNILPKDGEVFYYPAYFSRVESSHLFQSLLRGVSWQQSPIKMFGKEILQPRLTAWYGDAGVGYSYSGLKMLPQQWSKDLENIKLNIEQVTGVKFNGVLLNLYRSEADYMGWHRDNEKELGINPVVASVSFGCSRIFEFRHNEDKKLKISIELEEGSLLVMRGETQHCWQHRIPKRSKFCSERINLTFRLIS